MPQPPKALAWAESTQKGAFLSISQRLQMGGGRIGGALLTSDPVLQRPLVWKEA